MRAVAADRELKKDPERDTRHEQELNEKGFYMQTSFYKGEANFDIIKTSEYVMAKKAEMQQFESGPSVFGDPKAFLTEPEKEIKNM